MRRPFCKFPIISVSCKYTQSWVATVGNVRVSTTTLSSGVGCRAIAGVVRHDGTIVIGAMVED